MKEPSVTGEIDERDVTSAVESLNSASFKERFIRTDQNTADPEWETASGQGILEHVRDLRDQFKKEVDATRLHHFHGGVFQRFDSGTLLTLANHRLFEPVVPTARDLFHVYGPDRDNIKDWQRYYRYAWKDKGPHGIIFSSDPQIIREGKLACNSYAYSGQGSYALVGAGMLFRPQFGDAKIIIRPYVQWLTSASFTGNDIAPASAVAYLGIYVESWNQGGGLHNVDHDHWVPVWSQNTQSYLVGVTSGGAATGGDGLSAEVLAVTQRKYAIFVYVYLETSAGAQRQRNEVRFVTLDIDATVPYVVVEEKLS
ncbi:MAG TPA: hypothetical protein VNG69_18555 [Casimicrobiaceae bacterium]|nr:hypothetical protein [Casimicrobiaceae bacterium]